MNINEALKRVKANDPTLTSLELGADRFSETYGAIFVGDLNKLLEFAKDLRTNTQLQSLSLQGFDFCERPELLSALVEAFDLNQSLADLSFQCNLKNQVDELAEVLKKNTRLRVLSLVGSNLGDEEALLFQEVLKVNQHLKVLSFKKNNLGKGAAEALAEGLKDNQGLTELNLSHNKLKDEDLEILAPALRENDQLRILVLNHNPALSNRSLEYLGSALSENYSLRNLCLLGLNLDAKGLSSLQADLKLNYFLTQCSVSSSISGGKAKDYEKAQQAFKQYIMKDRPKLTPQTLAGITAIQQLMAGYLKNPVYKKHRLSLQIFKRRTLALLLANNNSEKSVAEKNLRRGVSHLASQCFNHRDFKKRVLADVLLVLSLAGLLVLGIRKLQGKSFFFSKAPTERQRAFEKEIAKIIATP